MDCIPRDLPIVIGPFDFSSAIPAANYIVGHRHNELAPRQMTIHPSENGYEDVLNEVGKELLERTRVRVDVLKDVRGTLKGNLQPDRTGAMRHADGAVSLCSWNNYTFLGEIVELSKNAPSKLVLGKNIQTSVIVLYEIGKDGNGWILTQSGTVYKIRT